MAIVYSYRLWYLSKHCIVPILSCYSHCEFLMFVVMALLVMPPHYRIRRLLSLFVLMLSPSRICILRCFPMITSFLSRIFTDHTSYKVVHHILVDRPAFSMTRILISYRFISSWYRRCNTDPGVDGMKITDLYPPCVYHRTAFSFLILSLSWQFESYGRSNQRSPDDTLHFMSS